MKDPFFTILTASFNNENTITQTMESVKNQSFQSFEHIVVDGNSTDKTTDILKNYESTYPLTWKSEPDEGIADALNKGLKIAQGHYILIIHADDYLISNHILEEIYSKIENEQFDLCVFPVLVEYSGHKRILREPSSLRWWHHFKTPFPHQGSLVHQRVYQKIGFFRKEFSIAMDYDFFYRAIQARVKVKRYKTPIAIMGGVGIGSHSAYWTQRIKEEFLVQRLNERNPFWKCIQFVYQILYFPYKTILVLKLRRIFHL
ncbi:MAG: glycosyltransferase family 2 protein [Candidatus Omnitrophota bacterium]